MFHRGFILRSKLMLSAGPKTGGKRLQTKESLPGFPFLLTTLPKRAGSAVGMSWRAGRWALGHMVAMAELSPFSSLHPPTSKPNQGLGDCSPRLNPRGELDSRCTRLGTYILPTARAVECKSSGGAKSANNTSTVKPVPGICSGFF